MAAVTQTGFHHQASSHSRGRRSGAPGVEYVVYQTSRKRDSSLRRSIMLRVNPGQHTFRGMEIVTIAERKARAAEAKRRAIDALCAELGEAALALGGRFLLFGSAARGEVRWDSDIDLLLDFPDHQRTSAAWTLVEQGCSRHDLACDVMPVAWCSPEFLAHVLPKAVALR